VVIKTRVGQDVEIREEQSSERVDPRQVNPEKVYDLLPKAQANVFFCGTVTFTRSPDKSQSHNSGMQYESTSMRGG
jgi:hypothetical protein